MTQEELAIRSGMSRPTVVNIETGKQPSIQLDTALSLCRALAVDLRELLAGVGATVDAADVVARFLASGHAAAAKPTPAEAEWLRGAGAISWLGDAPSNETLMYLLLALRARKTCPEEESR